MYKTGDLGRWQPDGTIEFLGRRDFQVKIRGFRIELKEIEHRLLNHPAVKEAVVIAGSSDESRGDRYLCGYIVTEEPEDCEPNAHALKEFLSEKLPHYMIPHYFIPLERIPLTRNGKVDRKALPEPGIKPGEAYTAPRDDVEKKLAEVWQETLGVEKVGIDDNFFDLGGDSIKAIQVCSRLLQFGLKLEVADLFTYPEIRPLRGRVRNTDRDIPQGMVTGEVPLTPIQKWFFETNITHNHHFNQSVMLFRKDGFDEQAVKKLFVELVEHHDALRMVYAFEGNRVIQENRGIAGTSVDLQVIDMNGQEGSGIEAVVEKEANRLQGGMDLGRGPLVKLGLFKTGGGDYLLIIIHHLVVDGVSWRILLEDITAGYIRVEKGEPPVFPPKSDSFKHWACKLVEYARSKKALKEISYWKGVEKAREGIPVLPRYRRLVPGENRRENVRSLFMTLNESDTKKMIMQVNRAYNTGINDILLTALALAIKEWAGLERIPVNLEGHGREPIIPGIDISRTVGWFTSRYPVVLDISKGNDLSYRLISVKETLRRIPNKGIGYGILKYLTPERQREGLALIFGEEEINFNYLGDFTLETAGNGSVIDMEVSRMSTGENVCPETGLAHAIDISGLQVAGKLQLRFSYNKYEFKGESIERLVEFYKAYLVEIIRHCCEKEEKELTPSDLGCGKISIDDVQKIRDFIGEENKIRYIYALSPMQNGMLFHALEDKASGAYFEQVLFTLEGEPDIVLFAESIKRLVRRYDILRTFFIYEDLEEPVQVVLEEANPDFSYEDISCLGNDGQARYLEGFRKADKAKGFDLTKLPLMRISILKKGERSFWLIWSFHHILMDGWCLGILYDDLLQIYRYLKEREPLQLKPEAAASYGRYIRWLEQQDREEGLSYWSRYLEGYEQKAGIPGTRKPLPVDEGGKRYKKEDYGFEIEEVLFFRLREIAGRYRVTLDTLFRLVWGILLQRYNNTDDVVFGSVVSGRPPEIEGIERMVGLFINTVPVRIRKAKRQRFSQLLQEVQLNAVLSKPHEYVSLAEVQSRSLLKRDLIDHIVVFENYPLREQLKATGSRRSPEFSIEGMESDEQTNYDLNIVVIPTTTLKVKFTYNSLVYDREIIKGAARRFREIIRQVTVTPGIPVEEIGIIFEEEKNRILYAFNSTESDYPQDKAIHELFREQAGKTPDNIALLGPESRKNDEKVSISYRKLDGESDRFVRLLKEKGVTTDTIVGIMVERSIDMIVGILGILKAGGAYMAIDPDYPEERKEYMLADSGANVLVTEVGVGNRFACSAAMVSSTLTSTCRVGSANLAYIIYTSGSTGRPKGVMVEHRSLVNLCFWHNRYFGVTGKDKAAQFAACGFDASVWEIFPYLIKGVSLHIIGAEIKPDIVKLNEYYERHKITIAFLPTQLCEQFMELENRSLRKLLTGGDTLHLYKERDYELYNNYGPTENTVVTTSYKVIACIDNIPIGKPVDNSIVYILGQDMQLQPIGVPGELCIGGDGLARGYLNRPELTNERFRIINYRHMSHIYKTGDLVRWLPDGNIEFLGRIDHQVKIRGYRIELGEVENLLRNHREVKEVVVLALSRESADKYLCAYIVPQGAGVFAENSRMREELRNYLSLSLPQYMIPAYFIRLEKMPLTPGGKVARNLLPDPREKILEFDDAYVAPGTEMEKLIADAWMEVLKLEKVGIHGNFFELGGNSIEAVKLSSRLKKVLGKEIPMVSLFQYPTVSSFAQHLKEVETGTGGIDKEAEEEQLELSENLLMDTIQLLGEE